MDIKIFGNPNFGDIRIAVNEKGEALFCLLDVCKALELANPSQVKTRLDSSNLISVEVSTKSSNRHGEFTRITTMTYIEESNLLPLHLPELLWFKNPRDVKKRLDSAGLISNEGSTSLQKQYGQEYTRTQTFTFIDEANVFYRIIQRSLG